MQIIIFALSKRMQFFMQAVHTLKKIFFVIILLNLLGSVNAQDTPANTNKTATEQAAPQPSSNINTDQEINNTQNYSRNFKKRRFGRSTKYLQDSLTRVAAITDSLQKDSLKRITTSSTSISTVADIQHTVFDVFRSANEKNSLINNQTTASANNTNVASDTLVQNNQNIAIDSVANTSAPSSIFDKTSTIASTNSIQASKPAPITNNTNNWKPLSSPKYHNFIFWTILLMLLFLTVAVVLNRHIISDAFEGFRNNNILKLLYKDLSAVNRAAYFSLYLLFILNVGIFVFLLMSYFNVKTPFSNVQTLLFCILAVGLAFLGKHILLWLVENIFPLSKEIKQYSFLIMIFSIILGIVLAPLNMFIIYVSEDLQSNFILFTLGIIGIVYIYRILRSIFIASPYIGIHLFHFLLYLCVVEIAPILVLTKLILKGV